MTNHNQVIGLKSNQYIRSGFTHKIFGAYQSKCPTSLSDDCVGTNLSTNVVNDQQAQPSFSSLFLSFVQLAPYWQAYIFPVSPTTQAKLCYLFQMCYHEANLLMYYIALPCITFLLMTTQVVNHALKSKLWVSIKIYYH